MTVLTGVAIVLGTAIATLIALHAYAQWMIRNIDQQGCHSGKGVAHRR